MLNTKHNNLLSKVARENGFNKFSIETKPGSKKGDNYLGEIYSITIKEENRELRLILKCAEKSDALRQQIPVSKCYEREVFMYSEVIPSFQRLQIEIGAPHQTHAFAKCHGFSLDEGEEFLLFEDLKASGFDLLDRKSTMDPCYIKTVVVELAKFHSLSFILQHLYPEKFTALKNNLTNPFQEFLKRWGDTLKKQVAMLHAIFKDDPPLAKAVRKCEKDIPKILEESDDEKFNILITHGDPWCNNLLFKHDKQQSNFPELRFLDFQLSKMGSPAFDLCYFLFLSASKEVIDDHKTYLLLYHEVVMENLRKAKIAVENVFPYDLLETHFKLFCKVLFFIAVGNLQNLLRDEQDVETLSEIAEKGSIFDNFFKNEAYNQAYIDRISNILSMLDKNNYI